ncbi:hypothetical protein [Larkinella arboricola]
MAAIRLVGNGEKPDGAGKLGLPPVAPVLYNAFFSATGKRIRTLPVDLTKV